MDLEPLALMSHLQGSEKTKARQAAALEGSEFHRRLQQLDRVIAPYVHQERLLELFRAPFRSWIWRKSRSFVRRTP